MRKKWHGLLFLIRTENGIEITGKCPKSVKIDKRRGIWILNDNYTFKIGENCSRLLYSYPPSGLVIGVYDTTKFAHLKKMLAWQDIHLRHILRQNVRNVVSDHMRTLGTTDHPFPANEISQACGLK